LPGQPCGILPSQIAITPRTASPRQDADRGRCLTDLTGDIPDAVVLTGRVLARPPASRRDLAQPRLGPPLKLTRPHITSSRTSLLALPSVLRLGVLLLGLVLGFLPRPQLYHAVLSTTALTSHLCGKLPQLPPCFRGFPLHLGSFRGIQRVQLNVRIHWLPCTCMDVLLRGQTLAEWPPLTRPSRACRRASRPLNPAVCWAIDVLNRAY